VSYPVLSNGCHELRVDASTAVAENRTTQVVKSSQLRRCNWDWHANWYRHSAQWRGEVVGRFRRARCPTSSELDTRQAPGADSWTGTRHRDESQEVEAGGCSDGHQRCFSFGQPVAIIRFLRGIGDKGLSVKEVHNPARPAGKLTRALPVKR
jgi:hypothetical protein